MAVIRDTTLGGNLGQALGTGLGTGLQMLAQQKMQEMQNKRYGQAFKGLGYPEELGNLPESIQKAYLGNYGPQLPQQEQYQENPEVSNLLQLLSGQNMQQPEQQQMQQQSGPNLAQIQDIQNLLKQPEGLRLLAGLGIPQEVDQQQVSQPQNISRGVQQGIQSALPAQGIAESSAAPTPVQQIEARKQQVKNALKHPSVNKQQQQKLEQEYDKLNAAQKSAQIRPTNAQLLAERKLAVEQQKQVIQEQKELEKETAPIAEKITKDAENAKKNNMRLGRMEELIKRGNLPASGLASFFKSLSKGIFGVGIDLTGGFHPDAQEFEKLSKDFLRGAKDVFGSRITNMDVDYYLQTIPTLMQSDEGKMRVIQNLRSFNQADLIKKQAMDDIIAENNGVRPKYLDTLVEKRVAPQLDAIAKQFESGGSQQGAVQYHNYRFAPGSPLARLVGQASER